MEPSSPPASPRVGGSLAIRPKWVDFSNMIPLQEAKDDSPIFKAKLKVSEDALDSVVNVVKKVVKSLKSVATDGQAQPQRNESQLSSRHLRLKSDSIAHKLALISHFKNNMNTYISLPRVYGSSFDQLTQEVQQLARFEAQLLTAGENGLSYRDSMLLGSSDGSSSSSSSSKRKSRKADRETLRKSGATHSVSFAQQQQQPPSLSPPSTPTIMAATGLVSESTRLFQEEMEHFAKSLSELEQLRRAMFDQIDKVIAAPLEQFYTQDVPQAKELSKTFQRTGAAFQAAASKFSQLKKGSSHYNETEIEWREAKRAHRRASMEYAAHLNRILPRKKMDILEKFTDLMMLQRTYFQQGHDIIQDIEPRLKNLNETIQLERRFLDDTDKKVSDIIEELSAAPDAMAVPGELDLASIVDDGDGSGSQASPTAAIPVGGAPSTVVSEFQGYLFKRNRKWADWKRAFFAVREGQFHYYSKDKSSKPDDSIDLLLCSVKPVSEADAGRQYVFELISPYKSFTLQAEDTDTMQRWINVIMTNVSTRLSAQSAEQIANTPKPSLKHGSSMSSSRKSTIAETSSASTASGSAGASGATGPNTTSSLSEADKKERQRILQQLHKADAQNAICADCGTESPTWSVINIGVLVCIECSGIHRSLGTHISKVRSVALDRVDSESIHMVQMVGNSNANAVLEAAVPTTMKKPTTSSTRAEREKWIKAKYADKAFVKPYKGVSISQDFITAVKNEDLAASYTLLLQGADPNCTDSIEHKKTPLHHAAYNGDIAMLELLLLNGANPNVIDDTNQMWTPLHYCALNNHSVLAALLFKRGAKIDIKDKRGRTPVDVAADAKHADCVTLLRLAQYADAERKQGKLDDNSFADALSAFSLDLSKSGVRRPGRRPPAPSISLPKSPVPPSQPQNQSPRVSNADTAPPET